MRGARRGAMAAGAVWLIVSLAGCGPSPGEVAEPYFTRADEAMARYESLDASVAAATEALPTGVLSAEEASGAVAAVEVAIVGVETQKSWLADAFQALVDLPPEETTEAHAEYARLQTQAILQLMEAHTIQHELLETMGTYYAELARELPDEESLAQTRGSTDALVDELAAQMAAYEEAASRAEEYRAEHLEGE